MNPASGRGSPTCAHGSVVWVMVVLLEDGGAEAGGGPAGTGDRERFAGTDPVQVFGEVLADSLAGTSRSFIPQLLHTQRLRPSKGQGAGAD